MRRLVVAMVCLLSALQPSEARDSLFGRRVRDGGQSAETAPAAPEKPADEASRPKPSEPDAFGQPAEPHQERQGGDAAKPDKEAPKDEGVRIRPVTMDEGVVPKERLDFRLSRIDKPLSHETTAMFREAWAAFRSQNALAEDGGFVRRPQATAPIKARLLQDLGDGRWFADAEWDNRGQFAWCPSGANADKAVVVLDEGQGSVGASVTLNVVHAGLVELRFDCEVPPAAGRRITIRRHAFLSAPTLPDDEATRQRFQQAVAAGKKVEVLLVQVRDCKVCGGLGYVRRPVPGKIQDARDPCPGGCEKGDRRVPVLVTFRS